MKKFKGLPAIILALFFCTYIVYNKDSDRYFTQFAHEDFLVKNCIGYSDETGKISEYAYKSPDTMTYLVMGPVSLKKADYRFELQYYAADEGTVMKVFASDYVNRDNAPGKVYMHQEIDPSQSAVKFDFTLDQDVDSLYIQFENIDNGFMIGRMNISSYQSVFTDSTFFVVCTVLFTVVILWLLNGSFEFVEPVEVNGKLISKQKTAQLFFFVMLCTVFMASLPLFQLGLFQGHDTHFHLGRVIGLARGLMSGQFPVRVHGGTLNDYGYPNSMFYGEAMMYVPAVLTIFGVSTFNAFKFYIFMVNAITVVLSYIAFKKFTESRYMGLTLSILYTLFPYRLLCVHYRNAIGEFAAMTFVPLVMYGLYAILFGKQKDWPWLVVGATGIIQSHFLSTEVTVVFAVIFVLYGIKNLFTKEKRILSLVWAGISTILLNFWFIVPMFVMMLQLGLKAFSGTAFPSGFSDLNLGYIFTIGTLYNRGLNGLGWVPIAGTRAFAVYYIITERKEEDEPLRKTGYLFLWLVIGFAIASTAYFPWMMVEKIPLLGRILGSVQFPFRYYTVSQVCAVALVGISIIMWCKDKNKRLILCAVSVCLMTMNTMLFYEMGFYGPKAELMKDKCYYSNYLDTQRVIGLGEYLIEGSNLENMMNSPVIESTDSSFKVTNLERYGTKTSFSYTADNASGTDYIILPISYIPNYVITVNGQRVQAEKIIDGGRVGFKIPASSGDVKVAYKEPKLFRLCELVTVAYIVYAVFPNKKKLADRIFKKA